MSETKRFIEIVRRYPLLYKKTDKDYKNNVKKDQIWAQIAENLGGHGYEWKKKWKNLRDTYHKFLRAQNMEDIELEISGLARYRTWPWAQRIEFLKPYMKVNTKQPTINPEKEKTSVEKTETLPNDTSTNYEENVKFHDDLDIKQDIVETNDVDWQLSSPPSPKRKNTVELIRTATQFTQNTRNLRKTKIKEQPTQKCNSQEHDDVELIFIGFAKTLKKFSARRQAQIKYRFSEILMKEELAQIDEEEEQEKRLCNLSTVKVEDEDPLME